MPFRGDLSVIRLFLAGDHAKERRLARAVRPDKADLFTLVEDGRSLDEKETVAVLLADIFNADHVDEGPGRSEEHTSELQSLMRISYAVFCLKKKKKQTHKQ